MLGNKTFNITWMDEFTFWAEILDDTKNNHIISVQSLYATNDVYQDVGGNYSMKYNRVHIPQAYFQGAFHLEPHDDKLLDNERHNGTLNVKLPLKLTLEVTHVTDDKFIVTATLTPKVQSNFTLKNELVFKFGDKTYIANLTDNGVQNGFYKWTIANATYELYNLSAGHYTISAYYPTDDTHNFVENSTPLNVGKRNTWINILVNDHVYGNLAIAIVNTNGNGTVLLSMNGRTERYDLSKGDGSYEGYNITNGVLYVTFDTLYGPGNYSMAVVYEGDDYYEYALNQTNFTVFKKNTTISAVSTNISFWDAEEINVTVDANASGYIKIK